MTKAEPFHKCHDPFKCLSSGGALPQLCLMPTLKTCAIVIDKRHCLRPELKELTFVVNVCGLSRRSFLWSNLVIILIASRVSHLFVLDRLKYGFTKVYLTLGIYSIKYLLFVHNHDNDVNCHNRKFNVILANARKMLQIAFL